MTGQVWGIEHTLGAQPRNIYTIDLATGYPDSMVRLGLNGTEVPFGFDGLYILPDGTFLATRGGGGLGTEACPLDSALWDVDPVPDPSSGPAEIALVPLTFDTLVAGKLAGLEMDPDGIPDSFPFRCTHGRTAGPLRSALPGGIMRTGIVTTIAVATVGAVLAKQPSVQDLAGVELEVSLIADSGSHLVYYYDLTNPSASTWGLSAIRLDIGALAGTPSNLAATGTFYDFTDGPGPAAAPHAAVGPITPSPWSATLTRSATLSWHPRTGPFTSDDSVAPGATKTGFGIRSSYLPGISSVVATPTPEACCTVPDSTADGIIYPPRSRFAVTGWAVAPRYMPEEVDIDLLQTQLTAICSDPLWLASSALCTEFEGLLDQAAGQFASTDLYGAAISLSDLLDRVEAEQQQMHGNAYWLLYHNLHQGHANIAAAGPISLGNVTPEGAPPATWDGLMVTSGTVWVHGSARAWSTQRARRQQ